MGKLIFHIGFSQRNGLGRTVDRVYEIGLAAQGIDREAAGVAEHVEYIAASGIHFKQLAVVALVNEEARLFVP